MRTLSQVRTLTAYTHKHRRSDVPRWCFVAAIFAALVLSGILNH